MKPRSLITSSATLLLIALAACAAPPPPPPPATVAPTPSVPAPKVLTPTVTPRGAVELTVDTRDSTVTPQALNPSADSSVSFPTTGRFTEVLDAGSNRYIMVRFPVTANQNFNNLTLVAYVKDGNAASSAFKAFQSFGGTPSSSQVYSIRPAHGIKLNGTTPEVDANKADLQVLTTAEANSITTAARGGGTPIITGTEYALEYGYVARRCTANCGTTPTWTRAFTATQTGQVTVAVRVPQAGDVTGYRFSMTFIVTDDTSTQYSQSLEEIGSNTVAGLSAASVSGATSVRVLCNSSYSSANRAFILGARMAGAGATPLAQYGAQFYRNATAASFSVIPNTEGSFAPGLAPLYTALNGATLTYAGGTTGSSLGAGVVNANGAFTFNPAAGNTSNATLGFTVSDDQGCTAAPQTAPVTVSGPVIWYVNSAFSGTSDGRKTNPFKTVAAASTASSNGQTIFVYAGNYGALTLKPSQNLFGQLEGIAVLGNSVVVPAIPGATVIEPPGTTAPVLAATNGDTLTLSNGVSAVRGVKLGGVASGTALKGTNFGQLFVSNTEINTPGAALNLDTGAINSNGSFKAISSGGGVNGIRLNAITGAGLSVTGDGSTAGSGGTIQGSTGDGVAITNSTGLNLRFMNFQNITGRGVFADIQGTVALNLVVKNNVFQNLGSQSNAVRLLLSSTGASTFDVSNNNIGTLAGTNMSGVTVLACSASVCNSGTLLQGRINNNTIIYPTSSDRKGIDVGISGNGKLRLEVIGNTIQNYGEIGLDLSAVSGNSNLQATITGNTISTTASTSLAQDGMWLHVGSGPGFSGNVGCFNIATATGATGNIVNVPTALGYSSVYLDQNVNTNFAIQGYTGAANSAAAVQTFVNSKNIFPSATSFVEPAGGNNIVNFTNATCETPSF
jgi:hypothetical protein